MIVIYPYLVMIRFAIFWLRLSLAVRIEGRLFDDRPQTTDDRSPAALRLLACAALALRSSVVGRRSSIREHGHLKRTTCIPAQEVRL